MISQASRRLITRGRRLVLPISFPLLCTVCSPTTTSTTATSSLKTQTSNFSTATPPEYKDGAHRSNAMELVFKVAPIKVSGNLAICDGGGGALGHPIEYITLNFIDKTTKAGGKAGICKWCGLRFENGDHHH